MQAGNIPLAYEYERVDVTRCVAILERGAERVDAVGRCRQTESQWAPSLAESIYYDPGARERIWSFMVQKRVLAFQHIDIDPPGYLAELLQEHSIPYDVVMVPDGALPDPAAYGAILSMGGPQYAGDEGLSYLVEERALIRRAVDLDVPFLGICLGGQLLANALGAPIIRKGHIEIGFFDAQLTAEGRSDPLFAGLPGYHHMFHWHEDAFLLPQGARRLAVRPGAPEQAFRYGRRAYGLQYHIELTPDLLLTWVRHHPWRDETIALLGGEAYEGIGREAADLSPPYRDHTRRLFENFLTLSSLL